MEKHIAAFSGACLLPRYARILKPGTYGSPVAPPFGRARFVLRRGDA